MGRYENGAGGDVNLGILNDGLTSMNNIVPKTTTSSLLLCINEYLFNAKPEKNT
jgi:hypothetical protein